MKWHLYALAVAVWAIAFLAACGDSNGPSGQPPQTPAKVATTAPDATTPSRNPASQLIPTAVRPAPTSVTRETETPRPTATAALPTPTPTQTQIPQGRPSVTPAPTVAARSTATPTPTQTAVDRPAPTPAPTASRSVQATPSAEALVDPVSCLLDGQPAPSGVTAMLQDSAIAADDETRIVVDGRVDDWEGRGIFANDAVGDAEAGFPDMGSVRAFVNDAALYLLIETGDPESSFDSFELEFQAGPRRLWIAWSPRWRLGPFQIVDKTTEWLPIGETTYSRFALDDALEARIDLRDMGSPDAISLDEVRVMAGECCEFPEWRAADRWEADAETPVVAETDPEWRLAPSRGAREAERLLAAPETRAINLEYDPGSGLVSVAGLEGAVPGGTTLLIGNLELNDYVRLRADGLGQFHAEVAAAPGSHVLIKQDVTGRILKPIAETGKFDDQAIAPGVLMRVPIPASNSGIPFAAAARLCCVGEDEIAPWAIEGTFERDALEPGGRLRISGKVTYFAAGPATPPPPAILEFNAYLLADVHGRQVGRSGKFVTPFLTATGLPIERTMGAPTFANVRLGQVETNWRLDGGRWVADFETEVRVPRGTRSGLYALTAGGLWDLQEAPIESTGLRPFPSITRDEAANFATLGAFTVGEPAPMRLAATLLADQVSEGSRGGVVAREDIGLFDIAPRAVTRHQPVVPRLDAYGDSWVYRLEPYAPMLDAVDRVLPNSPAVVFNHENSSLTVAIERPDGGIDVLGPSRLTRYAVKSPRTPWSYNRIMGSGGGELREIPQLQGDGDTFAYRFPMDGDYVVTLEGHIADLTGRVYGICGTYDLTVAKVLDIEASLLPGTPFEVGDSIAPTLTIMPGVPADVTYTVTHVSADGTLTAETFTGKANDNGHWDGDGELWVFQRDGEYRVDVEARYSEPDGNLWVGRLRFGSVVATPDGPIIAHGRRGSDGVVDVPRPWSLERDLVYGDASAPHMHFAYHTGDVVWGIEGPVINQRTDGRNAGEAVVTLMSVQPVDATNPLVERVLARAEGIDTEFPWFFQVPLDSLLRAGQVPLMTVPEVTNIPAGAHPDGIDLWAYTYSSAQRPAVRVREVINGDDVHGSYWRFGDAYHAQSGNGPEGDLPADFKFMYGGAVLRDPATGEGAYAIYGSAWVLLPIDDPLGARVMPPFQGAAGGPSGGPLFSVHGRDVDIFFMPLGVRPGAILESGDLFRMAGPIMPTLSSLVEYTVAAPDGAARTGGGRANTVGYFYDPGDDFVMDQPGLWTVTLGVTHDGLTSAGPVEAPFPTGGLLTPDGSTFRFVVVGPQTHRLDIETDLASLTPAEWAGGVRHASFQAVLPDGWSGDSTRVIVTMPGTVLVDEEVAVADGLVRWDLDAEKLNRLASNFDYESGIFDTVTVTFYAEGTLPGRAAQAAGTIVTHGARVPR